MVASSLRVRAIIWELNETRLCFEFFWRLGVLLVLGHVKSGVLHLVHEPGVNSTPFLLRRFDSVIFDVRRGSSSEIVPVCASCSTTRHV